MKRSHVDKRLESRAPPSATERGVRLLRDRVALAAFVDRLSQASPAIAAADRVAFALAPGDDVAHAVVARDGSGVTCLGPGMAFIGPEVPWGPVELFLKQQDEALAARRALQSVKDVDDDVSPLIRMVQQPHRLVRREWDVLRALAPLLGLQILVDGVKVAVDIATVAAQSGPRSKDSWEAMWRGYVGGAVSLTLAGDQRGAEPTMLLALAMGDVVLASRGLWYLANQPEATLAFAERHVDDRSNPLADLALSTALAAVGFRAPGFYKESERLRRRIDGGEAIDERAARREVKNLTVALAPLLLERFCVNAEELLKDRDALRRIRAVPGDDDVGALAAAAGDWHRDALAIWRPFSEERTPPRIAPRRPGNAIDVDAAALAMWRSMLRNVRLSPLRQPWLARLCTLAPIEALLPADEPDPDYRMSEGVSYLRDALRSVIGVPPTTPPTTATTPTTAMPKTPPNAPCPCGSGKKWKKCHGGASPPS